MRPVGRRDRQRHIAIVVQEGDDYVVGATISDVSQFHLNWGHMRWIDVDALQMDDDKLCTSSHFKMRGANLLPLPSRP